MKKIVLHLGLPKTATTSLQHNVLQKLHEQGIINFLGKNLDYCDKTGEVVVHNYSGKFIRDAVEEKISICEACELLKTNLVEDKLNVFSDEGLMVAYPGGYNLTLTQKIENLKRILAGYEVKVALTLRNPVDYLYSLYVQLYPDFYSQYKELNTFEKYAQKLLKEKNNILFESFFYDSVLADLQKEFSLEISYFEDLKSNKFKFYKVWAELLGITVEEFQELFEHKHINQKQKTSKGSKKIFSLKIVEITIRDFLCKFPVIFGFIKNIYNLSKFKKLINQRFTFSAVHDKPKGGLLESLEDLLAVDKYKNIK